MRECKAGNAKPRMQSRECKADDVEWRDGGEIRQEQRFGV